MTKHSLVHVWGGGMETSVIPKFDARCPAQSIAVGGGHFAVCSSDRRVFTWAMAASMTGEDGFSCGQLGHGDYESHLEPKVRERSGRAQLMRF